MWSASPPTCTPVDCGSFTAPANGDVTQPDTTFMGVATFACDAGYVLNGDASSTCQADGNWSTPAPTCDLVSCGSAPSAPANGSSNGSGTTFGSSVTYACDAGYTLTGSDTTLCQADGNWSDPAPTCVIVDCGAAPGAPTNGSSGGDTTTTFGSTVTYSCDSGYDPVGATSTTCGSDGNWTEAAPTCAPVDCGAFTAPTNGAVSQPDTTFGQTATFSCNNGYVLNGSTSATCQADGNWDSAAPTCDLVDCGAAPMSSPDGTSSGSGTTFGSTVTYSCNTGYDLVGSTSTTCQANGTWSDAAPACNIVDCDTAPAAPTNGSIGGDTTTTFGSTVTYSCDTGYNAVGATSSSCGSDGMWTEPAPTCAAVDCGGLSQPTNGTMNQPGTTFGSAATTFTCDAGYDLNGASSVTCLDTGSWSASEPTCDPVDCMAAPVAPTNGTAGGDTTTTFGSTVTYMCNMGYTLNGASSTTCDTDAMWSDPAPTCDIVDCMAAPAAPTNGSSDAGSQGTVFGETVTYACDTGYELVGSTTTTCQATGSWSNAAPVCNLLPTYCTIEYDLSGTFRIAGTPFGIGNGTFANQPGTLVIEFRDDGAGNIDAAGEARLLYYSMHQMFDVADVFTNVNAFSPTCSGDANPSTTSPPSQCDYDNNTSPIASGTLSTGSLVWDTCNAAADYNSGSNGPYTPDDVSSGPGCQTPYRSVGYVDCQAGSFSCGQGDLNTGINEQDETWVQPLEDYSFTGGGSGNTVFSSLSMTEINIPNRAPSRTYLSYTAARIEGTNTTCN